MTDIVKTSRELKLLAGFGDEDDRTISIRDPIGGITATQIHELATLAIPVLIGDKYGAAFTRFKEAKYVDKTEVTLDPETLQPT